MASFAKAFLLAALCTTSLAADCSSSGTCNDETSLVQVKSIVKHGNDRAVDEAEDISEETTDDVAEEKKADENIPVYVNGGLVEESDVLDGAVAGLAHDAAANSVQNGELLAEGAAEKARVEGMAEEAAVEAEPYHPNRWATPVTNWKAIADSTPAGIDVGEVNAAFGTNKAKVRNKIEQRAVENLAFDSKVREERKEIKVATAEALHRDRVATAVSVEKDRVEVAETAANRMGVVKDAVRKVNLAKEAAMAHGIKQRQAQQAAIIGRLVGAQEGAEEAARAEMEQRHAWEIERAANVLEAEKVAVAKKKAFDRAAVDKATEIRAAELGVLAARNRKDSEAVEAHSAAQTAVAEEGIEGPEGMKNSVTEHEANRVVEEYGRLTGKNQKVINDLSTAHDALAVADDGLAAAETKLAAAEGNWP